jgi:hypothetical protein
MSWPKQKKTPNHDPFGVLLKPLPGRPTSAEFGAYAQFPRAEALPLSLRTNTYRLERPVFFILRKSRGIFTLF